MELLYYIASFAFAGVVLVSLAIASMDHHERASVVQRLTGDDEDEA